MKAIAACDRNMAIGNKGSLLCHIPSDLKYFKEKTLGNTVVMGRKTLESLPGGRPLPNRKTVILSTTLQSCDAYEVAETIEELLDICRGEEVFICGGAIVYEEMMPYCDEIYLTRIDEEFEADAFFPSLGDDFEKVWESEEIEENGHRFHFTRYIRK